jgi:PAS domain S-box-containing protein
MVMSTKTPTHNNRAPIFTSYGLTVVLVAAAETANWGLRYAFGYMPPFITFYPVLMLAALMWGLGPALVATSLGGLIALYFFVGPVGSFEVALAMYLLIGSFISVVADRLRRAQTKRIACESEQRFSSLFETSQDAILLVNQETGRILAANPAACRLYGYTQEEFARLKDTDVSAEPEKTERAVLESVQSVPLRLHQKKDGTIFPVEITGGYFTERSVHLLTAFIRDITARKEMEDALWESETKLRAIFDNSRDAIAVGKNGTHVFVNPAFVSLFGYETAAEVIGTPAIHLLAPESRGLVMESIRKRAAGEPLPSIHEMTALRKDGATFLVEATISPYRLRGEEFTLAILRDITERKHVEEALRLSEEKFARLFATNPAALAVTRLTDGLVMEVNETWENMFGYDRDEVLGRTTTSLGFWPTPESRTAAMEELREKGSVVNAERTVVRRSGERFVALGSTALLNFGGEEAVLSAWLDIEDRKRAESELNRAKNKLEQQTRELQIAYDKLVSETRQREQVEGQLLQSQKLEAIGQLAGGIAHDFNNMLAVILGNAELALDEAAGGPDGAGHQLEQIIRASKRARDLVKQILTFSRKSPGQKKPLSLGTLVKETADLLRGSLPSTIDIKVEAKSDADTILADPAQVQQVIMNLSTNAAHAMDEGGGSLTLGVTNAAFGRKDPRPDGDMNAGRYVLLTVSDTGKGMPKKVRDKIFEPFFTTKDPGQGTGMGLAVVFGIVKGHGGAITVESRPGKGSTFRIFFPLSGQTAREDQAKEGAPPRGTERILLVDDEPSVVEMASATLKNFGYRVTTAGGGPEGWDEFRSRSEDFDLIITDHVMPELTGIRLAEKILAVRQNLPVILFTGYGEAVSPERTKAVGISEFLMKPVVARELAETVRQVLDDRTKA